MYDRLEGGVAWPRHRQSHTKDLRQCHGHSGALLHPMYWQALHLVHYILLHYIRNVFWWNQCWCLVSHKYFGAIHPVHYSSAVHLVRIGGTTLAFWDTASHITSTQCCALVLCTEQLNISQVFFPESKIQSRRNFSTHEIVRLYAPCSVSKCPIHSAKNSTWHDLICWAYQVGFIKTTKHIIDIKYLKTPRI